MIYNFPERIKPLNIQDYQYDRPTGYFWASKDRDNKIQIKEMFGISIDDIDIEDVESEFGEMVVISDFDYLFEVYYDNGDISVGIWPGTMSCIVYSGMDSLFCVRTRDYDVYEYIDSEFSKLIDAYATCDIEALTKYNADNKYIEYLLKFLKSGDRSDFDLDELKKLVDRHIETTYHSLCN